MMMQSSMPHTDIRYFYKEAPMNGDVRQNWSGRSHLRQLMHLMILVLVIGIVTGPLNDYNVVYGQSPDRAQIQQIFNESNELLGDANFSEAMDGYRQILSHGFESGPLYLNLGIAATRIDSLGLAKYYYLKASRFPEVSLAASEALSFVEFELGRRGARLPQLAWTRITQIMLFETNHNGLIGLGIIVLNIGVIFIVVSWLREYMHKLNRYLGFVFVIMGLLLVLGMAGLKTYAGGFAEAIQLEREIQLYRSPDTDAEIIQTGYEGFQYIVDVNTSANSPGWLYVRMGNGSRGWVDADHLKLL